MPILLCASEGGASEGEQQGPNPMEVLGEQYELVRGIRATGGAHVVCCRDLACEPQQSHPYVAVKVLRENRGSLGEQEYDVLKALATAGGAAHVVEPLAVFSAGGRTCVVLELLGESLHDSTRLAGAPLDAAQQAAHKLVSAVAFVHGQGVLHADLKPGNVAFDLRRTTLKLLDFGNAMRLEDVPLYFDDFEVQTLRYRAPEVVFGCPFGFSIDLWSAGLTLVEALAGQPLFVGNSAEELVQEWAEFFGELDARPFMHGKFFSQRSVPRSRGAADAAHKVRPASQSSRDEMDEEDLEDTPRGGVERAGHRRCRCHRHDCHAAGNQEEPDAPPALRRGNSGAMAELDAEEDDEEEDDASDEEDLWEAESSTSCSECSGTEDDVMQSEPPSRQAVDGLERTRQGLAAFLARSEALSVATNFLALDFLARLLTPDPAQRITATQALAHPFLANL